MENFIIIGIIVIVLTLCVFTTVRRFKSKSCCGSGSKTLVEHKKLNDPVIMKKEIIIEGMHCENCKAAVERRINRIDGAVCHVNLKKNTAAVEMSREISDEELKETIEELDFTVTEIKTEK